MSKLLCAMAMALIACSQAVAQRFREIEKGEADDAKQY